MYQIKDTEDTIAAISTPAGQGGIGIVRLSGKQAIAIAGKIFAAKSGKTPSGFKSFTVHFGEVLDADGREIIDEALVTVMRAPKSYTKQDIVEISCHGAAASLKAVLNSCLRHGARLAEPGEFTKRAFLNGRIDLAQAEAVLDIIQAKTDAFAKISAHQLKGDLSVELEDIRESLMEIYVEIEAIVNFPEDEVDSQFKADPTGTLMEKTRSAKVRVSRLLETSAHGMILKEGVRIALCGRPNVGKSSLLNALLKTPRAIVSSIAGTTRDTIEETAQIRGIPFQLTDTAGILRPRDIIEEEAVRRSHMSIATADLVLIVFDQSEEFSPDDGRLLQAVNGQNTIAVLNKADLPVKIDRKRIEEKHSGERIFNVSALKREGIDALEAAIVESVWHEKKTETHGILISNVRHIEALEKCRNSIERAERGFQEDLSLEFISEEIKASVNFLDNITGRNIDTDLLDAIFSKFCIGK